MFKPRAFKIILEKNRIPVAELIEKIIIRDINSVPAMAWHIMDIFREKHPDVNINGYSLEYIDDEKDAFSAVKFEELKPTFKLL